MIPSQKKGAKKLPPFEWSHMRVSPTAQAAASTAGLMPAKHHDSAVPVEFSWCRGEGVLFRRPVIPGDVPDARVSHSQWSRRSGCPPIPAFLDGQKRRNKGLAPLQLAAHALGIVRAAHRWDATVRA